MIPEPSGEQKAADQAAFAASLAAAQAGSDARQAQARAFQEASNVVDVPNVTAGQRSE